MIPFDFIHAFKPPRRCSFRRVNSKKEEFGKCYGFILLTTALVETEDRKMVFAPVDTITWLDGEEKEEIKEVVQ